MAGLFEKLAKLTEEELLEGLAGLERDHTDLGRFYLNALVMEYERRHGEYSYDKIAPKSPPAPEPVKAAESVAPSDPNDLHGQSGKGWIGVDLDGTLAEYEGWKGEDHIGAPIPRMVERVKKWLSDGKDVRIFTARVHGAKGQSALPYIQAWCREHLGREIPVTCIKDQKMTELWDDRAVQVTKNTGERVDGAVSESVASDVKRAAADTNTEPSEAQIKAGNYKKGRCQISGMTVAIENPQGSTRSGTSKDGTEWSRTLTAHYGYVVGSNGADDDACDCFLTDNPEASDVVYVVDQIDQDTGDFDECKAILGTTSEDEARKLYLSNYDRGWRCGVIHAFTLPQFKAWVKGRHSAKSADAVQDKILAALESAATPSEFLGAFRAYP